MSNYVVSNNKIIVEFDTKEQCEAKDTTPQTLNEILISQNDCLKIYGDQPTESFF